MLRSMRIQWGPCTVAFSAMSLTPPIGTAHAMSLGEGESFTSLDLQINFFRPVWNGRIRAVAKPVNVGRKTSRYVCDILRDDDKLVAQVTSTVMTLRGDQASGR